MTLTWNTIITAGAVLTAVIAFMKSYNRAYELIRHQKEQDDRIEQVQLDQTVILESLEGILDGLLEQGCDGNVKRMKGKLSTYLIENHRR